MTAAFVEGIGFGAAERAVLGPSCLSLPRLKSISKRLQGITLSAKASAVTIPHG